MRIIVREEYNTIYDLRLLQKHKHVLEEHDQNGKLDA